MGDLSVEAGYLAVGANRQTAVADWSVDGVICFGAGISIALWRPTDLPPSGISKLLSGHGEVVKAVKFLPHNGTEDSSYIVSGGDDCAIKLWAVRGRDGQASCIQTVKEHSAPINCIAVPNPSLAPSGPARTVFASGGADASIKIWSFENEQIKLLQSIQAAPKFFPLSLALSSLDDQGTALVLAAAGTKDIIQVFVTSNKPEASGFKLQATLSGHEGWIRSLDFCKERDSPDSDILLASASQDKYIRLWRIHRGKEPPPQAAMGTGTSMSAFLPGKSPSNKAYRLKIGESDYSITFEALLLGHDDWIYSAKWHVRKNGKLQLLSTSADNTLAIWEADPSSGIWVTGVRLGELSREKGATTATGSVGGFWTGLWSASGTSVVTLGRTGSWRRWDYDAGEDQWVQAISVSGHTKAVTGISWSKDGEYLLSTSSDQTSRLHAEWKAAGRRCGWHEMARPQIHGYDLNCISSLGTSQFVSGADEKLMRVFSEPKAVARLLSRLTGAAESQVQINSMPDAANMPVLGLSNKAIHAVDDGEEPAPVKEGDRDAIDPASVVRKSALDFDHPPFEDSLSRHTLWPEIEKLYGHGYEISCLAVSNDGKLIASACKATSVNHAVIRLFETEKWTEVKPPLMAHSLTATRLRFSADDQHLLSVGRDRQWAVFQREEACGLNYRLLQANPKGHTRMILDCAWAPIGHQVGFATAGRDKNIKIWTRNVDDAKTTFALAGTIPQEHAVTAIDFLWRRTGDGHLVLAVGTEAGKLSILSLKAADLSVHSNIALKPGLCLAKAVLQLAWRPPQEGQESQDRVELAIAGEDSSLRIYIVAGI